MKLHAAFEIEPSQVQWFRDRLPRLADEINHGGLEITLEEPPVIASEVEQPVETALIEDAVEDVSNETLDESADSGPREETSGDTLIVAQGD